MQSSVHCCHSLAVNLANKNVLFETVSFCSQSLKLTAIPLPPSPKLQGHSYPAQVNNFSKSKREPGEVTQWQSTYLPGMCSALGAVPRTPKLMTVRGEGVWLEHNLLHSQGRIVMKEVFTHGLRCPPVPCSVTCLPWVLVWKSGRHKNSERPWAVLHGCWGLKHGSAPEFYGIIPDEHFGWLLTAAHLSLVLNEVPLSGILVLSIHYLLKNISGVGFMNKTIVNIHVQVFMWTNEQMLSAHM